MNDFSGINCKYCFGCNARMQIADLIQLYCDNIKCNYKAKYLIDYEYNILEIYFSNSKFGLDLCISKTYSEVFDLNTYKYSSIKLSDTNITLESIKLSCDNYLKLRCLA